MKKYIYDRLADGSFKPKIARPSFDQTFEAYRYLESNEQIAGPGSSPSVDLDCCR